VFPHLPSIISNLLFVLTVLICLRRATCPIPSDPPWFYWLAAYWEKRRILDFVFFM
jgi:hypothetical protein